MIEAQSDALMSLLINTDNLFDYVENTELVFKR